MPNPVRRLLCWYRGQHDDQCTIVVLPTVGLQEHTHSCDNCGLTSLATITRIDPQIASVMGLPIEDQQHTYLN